MTHTPVPYLLSGSHDDETGFYFELLDNEDRPVATIYMDSPFFTQDEAIANGKFIVKACNMHEELIQTLIYTLTRLENMTTKDFSNGADKLIRSRIETLLALAKAREENGGVGSGRRDLR